MSKTFRELLQKRRNTKSVRVGLLLLLLLVLLALYFIGGKMKTLLLVLVVLVLTALGLQLTNYDIDLGTLWQTWSLSESRVEQRNGLSIIWSACTTDNLNCADFATQTQAQETYELCASKIARDNKLSSAEEVKSLDIYGLDGDKDGKVCEHLPQ